eukprot:1928006-Ditylum_brightwellii.AAC.1
MRLCVIRNKNEEILPQGKMKRENGLSVFTKDSLKAATKTRAVTVMPITVSTVSVVTEPSLLSCPSKVRLRDNH